MTTQIRPGLAGIEQEVNTVFDIGDGRWAVYDWAMLLKEYPSLAELIGMAKIAGVDAHDAFFALAGYEVKGNDNSPMAEAWRELIQTSQWREAREQAKDMYNRAALLTSMLQRMVDRKKADVEDAEHEQTLGDMVEDGDGEAFEQLLPPPPEEQSLQEQQQDAAQMLEDMVAKMVQAESEQAPGEPEESEQSSLVMTTQDVQNSVAQAKAAQMVMGYLEGKNKGELLGQAMSVLSKMDIRAFANLLGFIRRSVRGAIRETQGATGEMVGYGVNGWSDAVTPLDQLLVAQGDIQAFMRLAEQQLTTRRFIQERPMGKGPCVLLRDETGSMADNRGDGGKLAPGSSHSKALAFEVVLADTFNNDGRDLYTIAWGGSCQRHFLWGDDKIVHSQSLYYEDTHTSSGGLAEHLGSFINGQYTKIYKPLEAAIDFVDEYVPGADILILTDGYLHSEIFGAQLERKLKAFRDVGGELWVVLVGENLNAERWKKSLPFVSDVITVDDISSGNADLQGLLSKMARPARSGKRLVSRG